ncbi:MAG TPA: type I methionyl aminopeptidase [Bacteroidales bacterium]|jgi:methionyl aminopeptidase|nr:type I methionyl aminopeptidase [Bacteroidales bacterium]HNR42000.1 type I methionyl aminopeptidase [Bacteroidales bacterium]
MLYIKTDEEVGLLRKSNMLVSKTLAEVASFIRPGITTLYLDGIAESYIRDNGGIPAFKGYGGFPATLCTSVNEEIVHGIPSGYVLREGDIISVDCGVILGGWYGDSAYTFPVGEISDDVKRLLRITKESLEEGAREAVAGNRVGDISHAVQKRAESGGYSVVRELVGHGLGRKLHEPPEVPNYGKRGTGIKLEKGMVICIEPMINMGKKDTIQLRDGWTVRTLDGKPSAHFEYAVAVDKGKADILTTFEFIEEVLNKM